MIKEIAQHRSVRRFLDRPIPAPVMDDILQAASRASTVGNMQLYSIVVTADRAMREQLAPCHFNQPMVTEAPVLLTFCADIHRFSQWCRQRDAEPCYDNFLWFVNAATDALLAAENAVLQAEAHGLGICILGTALYSASEIVRILELPRGVIPVTAMSVGYPAEMPPLTDRLPLEAIVHCEKYNDYTPDRIDELWAERESSEQTSDLLRQNGLPNLARIFTERRYAAADNLAFSRSYFEVLRAQGFFNQ